MNSTLAAASEPMIPIADWFLKQKHRVIYTPSSAWVEVSMGAYQAFPYHLTITPPEDELAEIFQKHHATALRYSAPMSSCLGKISYHAVCDRATFPGTKLSKRYRVKQGLKYATYSPISLERLAGEGWDLRRETLIRQARVNAEDEAFWRTLCLSAAGIAAFEAWGAIHEGKLVAALLACTLDDTVSILYQQSLTDQLKFGVNNALSFVFTEEALNRPGVRCVFYGLESLDAPASVDEFKFYMGYSAKPVRQRVMFHPYIAALIQPHTHSLLKALRKAFPAIPQFAKAEGMVRFCLQGMRPPSDQEWSEVLQGEKESILALAG